MNAPTPKSSDGPSEPWAVWKPIEVTSGRWQAVFDERDPFQTTRHYDWEVVASWRERFRRAVLFERREDCEARCGRLNSRLDQTGGLRDLRSSFPVPEDRHG